MSFFKSMPFKFAVIAFGFVVVYFVVLNFISGEQAQNTLLDSQTKPHSLGPVKLGMTSEEVIKLFGEPRKPERRSSEDVVQHMTYPMGPTVILKDNKVVGWRNSPPAPDTKYSFYIADADPSFESFGNNARIQDVLKAMGTPDSCYQSVKGNYIYEYDYSLIGFDLNEKIRSWTNFSANLKVKIDAAKTKAEVLSLGSSIDDIITVLGQPKGWEKHPNGETFKYGDQARNIITLDASRNISAWFDPDKILKISLGKQQPDASPFTIGASSEEVVAAMGTPNVYEVIGSDLMTWRYGDAIIEFENNKVDSWNDPEGILKVR
jgi:hypothetical protein